MRKNNILIVDDAEHATILAALRLYQQQGMGDPSQRPDDIHEIATNGDEVTSSLDDAGIDELAEKINFDVDRSEALEALKEAGLSFGECVNAFGVSADEDPFAKAADENFHSDGDIEIDGTTVVSHGDDYEGAYVLAWKWVSAEEAGIYRPSEHIDNILCEAFDARQDMSPSKEVYDLQVYADFIEKVVGSHSDKIDEYDLEPASASSAKEKSFSEITDDGRTLEVYPSQALKNLISLIKEKGSYGEDTSRAIEFVESNIEGLSILLSKLQSENE
jgi:hypothetical protein